MKTLLFITLLAVSCSNVNTPGLDQLQADIEEEFCRSPGLFSLAFKDLGDTSHVLLIQAHESMHAASTVKTPVMIEVFRQVEKGRLSLDDSITVENRFFSIVDSSVFSLDIGEDSEESLYEKIGEKVILEDLIEQMITHSSNLATNLVIGLVGADNVTGTMRSLGAQDIRVLRGVEDIKAYELGMSNMTTAYDEMLIYEALVEGKVASESSTDTMISILKRQHFNEGIPALLPADVEVAHKTGWISAHRHDSAIVFLPDGRTYVLAILTKGWESDDLATEIMANVSRLVYKFVATQRS